MMKLLFKITNDNYFKNDSISTKLNNQWQWKKKSVIMMMESIISVNKKSIQVDHLDR